MSAEPPWILTKGKVLTPVVGFQNGLSGNPPMPLMRGDAKPPTSWDFPNTSKNPSSNGLSAFGLDRVERSKGSGK